MFLDIQLITPTAKLPTRAHADDAGLDLYADETVVIYANQQQLIKTGLRLAIPYGFVGLVWDKSGLAQKGLHCLAGVIDAGYRGDLLITVFNLSSINYEVQLGQKIAQLLIQPIKLPTPRLAQVSINTTRSDQGFGSTGL
ncbi:dUTP diphosphatase [Candidatus Falkowbacteria bacterium CG10_big_fil_rev_8_21_14_0_10_37_14]|uniref:dUTP diphosphatase n=1 Tax=Candidatus Falkowbacteria bacterium CG10_big_fil_rev_8_21_14_0_10_37_14 TaxID=1974561 RepID=A0A2M6WSQ8_9BACT|nr:dUTP diphosphatase [Candidatus Falkowbacteria bacterium]PIT95795.1 MAG: dUTP diphosphatase [Candidatus Falkowbacteria bacterium CG10_big_fil_rev_8_21_14_0_10_37_14]